MRLVGGDVQSDVDTKVSRAVSRVYHTWETTRDTRSTQMVFCDLSTPNPDRFNVYDDIRDKLIARGIPVRKIWSCARFSREKTRRITTDSRDDAKLTHYETGRSRVNLIAGSEGQLARGCPNSMRWP